MMLKAVCTSIKMGRGPDHPDRRTVGESSHRLSAAIVPADVTTESAALATLMTAVEANEAAFVTDHTSIPATLTARLPGTR